ncbi:Clavaminate synthase-like protein [Trametes versicolor FP-101664 SS1]|uniref:Clavaminate synthase-like protein n=1 Tax=Trametes versicolor (strain FP-101664) TaxID=717944 RepID=R7S7M6_TRAVS|nr:Clavaminate synthase-like protein [Trametes versicolor FP-101664 SS1]EIW52053.1 Clavaminate synthase-like protein [Trametes versicolor FP-101664 SS1]
MPVPTVPSVPHYVHPPPTKEDLEWADLPIIDFSNASTPEGRAVLTPQVCNAMQTSGFMYIINHGMTQAENDRIFDIADVPFSQVPEEEMKRYVSDIKATGSYRGFKPRRIWEIDNGVRDQLEHYNTHRSITKLQSHPKALQPFLPEMRAFTEYTHNKILTPILQILARGLELPEDTFANFHGFDDESETYLRFMKYYPRPEEDEEKAKNVWLKGHTDIGTVTVLWSQPVSALQILCPDGKWRWIKHIDNALVVNIGDSMEFLSGGFYKGTIHRVRQPPVDQQGCNRLGVFYFGSANADVRLKPLLESPVLQRVGVVRRFDDDKAPTMDQYRSGRTAAYGLSPLTKKDNVVEEQIIHGVPVRHYN